VKKKIYTYELSIAIFPCPENIEQIGRKKARIKIHAPM